jgi:hypothetical protein
MSDPSPPFHDHGDPAAAPIVSRLQARFDGLEDELDLDDGEGSLRSPGPAELSRQLDVLRDQLDQAFDEYDVRLEELEARAADAEARATVAESRASVAESHAARAAERVDQVVAMLEALDPSTPDRPTPVDTASSPATLRSALDRLRDRLEA